MVEQIFSVVTVTFKVLQTFVFYHTHYLAIMASQAVHGHTGQEFGVKTLIG